MNKLSDFKIDLAHPQKVVFDVMLNLNYAVFRLPRGGGKDFLLSIYALLYACSNSESVVTVVSPSYRQSKFVFEELCKLIFRYNLSELLLVEPTVSFGECFLDFKNKARVRFAPCGGYYLNSSDDVVLISESNHMPLEFMVELVDSIERGHSKKVFLMSTGYRVDSYMSKIEAHPSFSICAFGCKSFPEGFYDQSNIDEAKKILTKDEFDMEYNAKVCA